MLGLVQKVQNEVAAQENIVTHLKCFTDVSRQNKKKRQEEKDKDIRNRNGARARACASVWANV